MYHTILFVMPLPELFIIIREVMEILMAPIVGAEVQNI